VGFGGTGLPADDTGAPGALEIASLEVVQPTAATRLRGLHVVAMLLVGSGVSDENLHGVLSQGRAVKHVRD
jgi:hypothetical protein